MGKAMRNDWGDPEAVVVTLSPGAVHRGSEQLARGSPVQRVGFEHAGVADDGAVEPGMGGCVGPSRGSQTFALPLFL